MSKGILFAVGAISLAIGLMGASADDTRTWTSSDGERTFEARIREFNPETGQVTVIVPNGQSLSFSEEVLSAPDREYLAAWREAGGRSMAESGSSDSAVAEQIRKTRLHRIDGRRYRRAEIEKTPEFYLFYYAASW